MTQRWDATMADTLLHIQITLLAWLKGDAVIWMWQVGDFYTNHSMAQQNGFPLPISPNQQLK